jgi:hypothetical protein
MPNPGDCIVCPGDCIVCPVAWIRHLLDGKIMKN